MDLGLKDVHVLVTGASGGIGLGVTKMFLAHGAKVTGQYMSNSKPLTNDKIKASGQLQAVQADVTDEKSIERLFEQAGQGLGQEVQVLIVSHGVWASEETDLVDMELSEWNRCVNIDMTGPFLVIREFLRRLRSPRPNFAPDMSKVAVVIIGSTSGNYGEPGHVEYACAKSALQIGLVRTLKNEIVKIAPDGRVNAVSPGWVKTSMAESLFANEKLLNRTLTATPLNRIATVEDVASQVLVLASCVASRHVTGENVILAGGLDWTVV